MNNGSVGFQNLSKMKEAYDTLYQENSSYRESLLVSPYYSKFEKKQSRYQLKDNQCQPSQYSLMDYIRPFQSQQFNKTEIKQKMRRKQINNFQNRKKTQSSENSRYSQKDFKKFQRKIDQLNQTIKEKDNIICLLEKNLAKVLQKNLPTLDASIQNDNVENINSFSKKIIDQSPKRTKKNPIYGSYNNQWQKSHQLQVQIQNYKKQIRFLTKNNQQLYQQVQTLNEHHQSMNRTLKKIMLYVKDLQQKVFEFYSKNNILQEINQQLIIEKQQMIKNYQQQLVLFRKMKKIWEDKYQNTQNQIEKMGQYQFDKQKILNKNNKQMKRTKSSKSYTLPRKN